MIGLAPGAHGANRTGRMFTGDRSGDFLYRALFETGFASQASSISRGDSLSLSGMYITAAARCAPPDNRPTPEEFLRCRPFLERELAALSQLRVVVALGALALNAFLEIQKSRGIIKNRGGFLFGHGKEYRFPGLELTLLASYHPSQQNTQTGRLTDSMLRDIFTRARTLADS